MRSDTRTTATRAARALGAVAPTLAAEAVAGTGQVLSMSLTLGPPVQRLPNGHAAKAFTATFRVADVLHELAAAGLSGVHAVGVPLFIQNDSFATEQLPAVAEVQTKQPVSQAAHDAFAAVPVVTFAV
jgi:hypothetical protein